MKKGSIFLILLLFLSITLVSAQMKVYTNDDVNNKETDWNEFFNAQAWVLIIPSIIMGLLLIVYPESMNKIQLTKYQYIRAENEGFKWRLGKARYPLWFIRIIGIIVFIPGMILLAIKLIYF